MDFLGRQVWIPQRPQRRVPPSRAGLYGLLLALASMLGLAKTVGLAQILGSEGLGYYGVVIIVLPFGTYLATAGTLAALGAELPMAFGARDPDVAGLRDRALGLIVLSVTFVTAVYLAIVAIASPHDPDMRTALLLAALTVRA